MEEYSYLELADRRAAFLPLWRESAVVVELGTLRLSPVYYGLGVSRGDDAAVIPIPGFMGFDLYLMEMRRWLRRIGYRSYRSGIGYNADCLDVIARRLFATMDRAADATGRRVHLVGHSLGGIIARTAAAMRPWQVASVVTMGSPIRGIESHPLVLRFSELVRAQILRRSQKRGPDVHPDCYTGYCDCAFVEAATGPYPRRIPEMAIFTRQDGVVAWRFCRHGDSDRDFEVRGTHTGLAFNPAAWRALAEFLERHPAKDARPRAEDADTEGETS